MPEHEKPDSVKQSVGIFQRIESLNSQIDEYNRQLSDSGNREDQYHLIEEIKSLHKEINRINLQLIPIAKKPVKN